MNISQGRRGDEGRSEGEWSRMNMMEEERGIKKVNINKERNIENKKD